MEKREEEKDKNKNRIIIILLILIMLLGGYIFFACSCETAEEGKIETSTSEIMIDDDNSDDEKGNESDGNSLEENSVKEDNRLEEGTEDHNDSDTEMDDEGDDSLVDEAESKESTVKFGLAFSQRNEIWWKYQKRQDEIIKEAKALNEDRFSKVYLKYVDGEIKKLRYKLETDYKLNQGALDYILQEGKNGKFNETYIAF